MRAIDPPAGITSARTLPAAWYADPAFFRTELDAVYRAGWVCAAVVDDLPAPGGWRAVTVGGLPVLLVVDADSGLRAFYNVCRHRGAPLCDGGSTGAGSLIRCPYHAWLYRLDGSLARAQGVGEPEGFDPADHSLKPVSVARWRRFVFVNATASDVAFDLGPLAAAIDAYPVEDLDLVVVESDERRCNWKVLLENYSENYHTPHVHPEIDTSGSEDYPMVSAGPVLYAWDRPRQPQTPAEILRATVLPGEPGWSELAAAKTARAYDGGSYLTVWPNLMLNVFPDAALAMWMEPTAPNRVVVERRLFVAADCAPDVRERIVAAHALVHRQDVAICERVQRTHDAGIDADGVLSAVEEHGVWFVHEHLRAALGSVAG